MSGESRITDRAHLWRAAVDATGRVPGDVLAQLAAREGLSLLTAQAEACEAGVMPARYARNAATLAPSAQAQLLRGRVLLVGLGGLGGYVLELLARMGVGHITAVDGDFFEESNANRQLLATKDTLGLDKAGAARDRVAAVNPAVELTLVDHFVHGEDFFSLAAAADVVVDALGGLADRPALHAAAAAAGKPVVCAGIAGFTGWVAVVRPGHPDPLGLLHDARRDAAPSVEERLGNLAPTAAMAAAWQSAEVCKLLCGEPAMQGMLVFDLRDAFVTRVTSEV